MKQIGKTYKHKNGQVVLVEDIYKTYNSKKKLEKVSYEISWDHGRIHDYDVPGEWLTL